MLDPLLRGFVGATGEADAQCELDTIIERHALPLARVIVGRKLRPYSWDRPGRSAEHDADDVVADAMLTLIGRLHAARSGIEEAPVEDFLSYTAAVVHSACAHHIRRRYPERARMKNRLRYVFSIDPRLAVWMTDEGDLACGLAEWRGRALDPAAARALRLLIERGDRKWLAMTRAALTAATLGLVIGLGGAVEFEALVRAAAAAAGVTEPRGTGDPANLPSRTPAHDLVLDQRRSLARVWDQIQQLPVRQRVALLLNLRQSGGVGLLWLLPVLGVATVRQIARALEIPGAEFAELWERLPLDDAAIGLRLGCTRQQVINLRMAARRRLMNREGAFTATGTGRVERQAHLAPVSGSLKDSA
jgi:DNA-directed RNA polymerase specialized sigma24 family protein